MSLFRNHLHCVCLKSYQTRAIPGRCGAKWSDCRLSSRTFYTRHLSAALWWVPRLSQAGVLVYADRLYRLLKSNWYACQLSERLSLPSRSCVCVSLRAPAACWTRNLRVLKTVKTAAHLTLSCSSACRAKIRHWRRRLAVPASDAEFVSLKALTFSRRFCCCCRGCSSRILLVCGVLS